jgi:VanZ family protein
VNFDPGGRRAIRWTPVAGIVLLILWVTLGRTELPQANTVMIDWCVSCGSQWGIDFVLNIALFVPLGLAIRLAGATRRSAVLAVVATTLAIELVQLAIPGRVTSTGDLLANSVGGIAGYALAGHLRAIFLPADRQALVFVAGAGAFVPALLALTLWLFHPAPTAHPYWGQFAPALGQFAQFDGRIVEASVGGEPLRIGRLANTGAVRARLEEDGTVVRAVVVPGPPTVALAPAVSIFDGEQNEVMLIGRDGDNLVFRLRSRATRLGLRTPSVTVWNAYRIGSAAARDGGLRLAGRVRGYSISADARADTACASRTIAFRPTQGWAYLLPFEHLYTPRAPRFTMIWMALLFAPLGYYVAVAVMRHHRWAPRAGVMAWVGAAAAASLVAVPTAAGLARGTSWEWQGLAAGLLAGGVLGAGVMALSRGRHREPEERSRADTA